MRYRRVLVTGGAGFIGSHVVDRLVHRGHEVTVFDNLSTGERGYVNPKASFVHGDVRHSSELSAALEKGVDAVLHIAGQASIRLSFDNPSADLAVNTLGTLHIIEQCAAFGVSRLLFASSMTIYGMPQMVPTSEAAAVEPISYYAVTKYAAERYVHIAGKQRLAEQPLNTTSLRMFNVYGPRQSLSNPYQGVIAIFIGRLLRGEPIEIHGSGQQSRDFVYVDDVAEAWAIALENPATYDEVINVGSGQAVSVNRVCDAVLSAFAHDRSGYPVHSGPAQPGDIAVSCADISKAKRLLGWSPCTTFEEGMAHTVNWALSTQPLTKHNWA